MLTEVLPELRSCSPGNIQAAAAPELRNLVIVDNTGILQREGLNVSGTIDWREIIMWQDHAQEEKIRREVTQFLDKDDIINLQFTRWVFREEQDADLITSSCAVGLRVLRRPFLCVSYSCDSMSLIVFAS